MDIEALGRTPVHKEKKAGADARYDPDFESLQNEISKMVSPTEKMDWERVKSLAAGILETKSKDILAASYLSVALIHTDGLDGFAAGLTVYGDLLAHFWEELFPPKERTRGRMQALEWWVEKTEAALKRLHGAEMTPETRAAVRERLARIDGLVADVLEDAPSVRPVYQALEALQAPPADAAAEGDSVRENAERPASGRADQETGDGPPDAETEAEAMQALTAAYGKIRRAAADLQRLNPADPLIYRSNRVAAWAAVLSPPSHTDGRTGIQAPAPQAVENIKNLKKSGNWAGVLTAAEAELSRYVFWLDVNRFSAEALQELGEGHERALKAVCDDTAVFMRRLPGIERLAFTDGTPFADENTQTWLKDIRGGTEPDVDMDACRPEVGPEKEDDIEKIVSKARTMAAEGGLETAVTLLQRRLNRSDSLRASMRWRMAMAGILLESDQAELAMPNIDHILETIDFYHLESWDPALALQGLKTAWSGFSAFKDKPSKKKAESLLKRIAAIDIAAALPLKKE